MNKKSSPTNKPTPRLSSKSAEKKSLSSKSKATRKPRHYVPAEERRHHILETARIVFAEFGLKGARTRQLAEAAGINQSTLFEHFASKEDLFISAVVDPMVEIMKNFRGRTIKYTEVKSTDDLQSLLQIGMQKNLENTIKIYPLFVQALFSDQALGERLYREHLLPLLQARADFTKDLIDSRLDAKLLQIASFGIFFAIAMNQAMSGEPLDVEEVSAQVTHLIAFGAQPRSQSD